MRFFADGPCFPDDLLTARDEGQVLFFCGAGVSRAFARLPDFYGLADKVVEALRVAPDSPARRLIDVAKTNERIAGVGGLIPADRVFAVLEREFLVADVRAAVAEALRPNTGVDLTAHRILLDLARDPTGAVRLVTTNFDLLFEACDPRLTRRTPPNLPDPRRAIDFNGVIHLHGRLTDGYDAAHEDEFVLSSADFGRAYLADGWATRFIRSLLNRYRLVFVGYAADDPPVQYLLEALSRDGEPCAGLYAFQGGDDEAAAALWTHKGVQAIPYDPGNDHAQLWQSLGAWAERARNPDAWKKGILSKAMAGPRHLSPFERGQVKHLVSTTSGARAFAEAAPSAEWLCTFDRIIRYSTPFGEDEGSFDDPFVVYGLDDDPAPASINPMNSLAERAVPPDAWDGLIPNDADLQGLSPARVGGLRGINSMEAPQLPPRLGWLSTWLAQVSDQPAAVWWAANQRGLHPDLQYRIRRRLQQLADASSVVEGAWRHLLRCWNEKEGGDIVWMELEVEVGRSGWSPATINAWAGLIQPRLEIGRPFGSKQPPESRPDLNRDELLRLEVKYPRFERQVPFPVEALPRIAAELRRALETGIDLEMEINGFEGLPLPPIEADPDLIGDAYTRKHGIAGLLFEYLAVLESLLVIDQTAVRAELGIWRRDSSLFSRLRVWAAGNTGLLKPAEAARTLLALDRKAFWDEANRRDLLLALQRRWPDFPIGLRRRLEGRLLRGPSLDRGKKAEIRQRRAHRMLRRLLWLSDHGCAFSTSLEPVLAALRSEAPHWKDNYAQGAADSHEGRGGWVGQDPSTRGLEYEPPATLLARAAELGGHDFRQLIDRVPLVGLSESKPARVLRALGLAAGRGEDHADEWQTFLLSEARTNDRLRLVCAIGHRLLRLPKPVLAGITHSLSEWMLRLSEPLQAELPRLFAALWSRVLETMRERPECAASSLVGSAGQEWVSHSINAPAGKLAEVLIKDPTAGANGPHESWLMRADSLLNLGGTARRDAIVIFVHQLPWLYHHVDQWTEERLLSILGGDAEDEGAFWAGFFWASKLPVPALFRRLKPHLLEIVSNPRKRRKDLEVLAGLILAGWRAQDDSSGQSLVSDEEMQEALRSGGDAFRCQVLWQMRTWNNPPIEGWGAANLRLLREVWPRDLAVRSENVSAGMFSLAVEAGDHFEAFVDAVTPLMTKLSGNSHCMFALAQSNGKAETIDPLASLKLIFAALPESSQDWPYGAEVIVERLAKTVETASDPRTTELRRRLAAR
jgi:hypothetical protein